MTTAQWQVFVNQARANGGESQRAAEAADLPARYATPEKEMAFKDDVASKTPAVAMVQYQQVCEAHQCIGEPIAASAARPFLNRTLSVDTLLRKAIWQLRGGAHAVHLDVTDRRPLVGQWRRLDKLVPPDATDACFFYPGRTVGAGEPGSWSVFANLHPDDRAPTRDGPPRPQLLAQVAMSARTGERPADTVIRMTAIEPPGRALGHPPQQALLTYASGPVGQVFFPVPPDGRGFARFRPVPPGTDDQYGRSWPEGLPPNAHLTPGNGVNEVVHRNAAVPVREVWCYNLGEARNVRSS